MLWSVLQPAAHHLCRNSGRIQSWLIFPKSEMFWHVYLFNLFILTSSDYNWQQRVELTLGSVLDLSVTITQKECEEKSTRCLTIASGQGGQCSAFLSWRQSQPQIPIFTFKNAYGELHKSPKFIFFLFNKKSPSSNILGWKLRKINLKKKSLFHSGICFLGFLLFYGSLEIKSQQMFKMS